MSRRGAAAFLVLALAGGALWVRLAPLPADRYHRVPVLVQPVGDWPEAGAFEAVRQVPDPKARLVELDGIIREAAQTEALDGTPDEGLMSYVTRSALIGFPAIITLWIEGDRLHLRGASAFGPVDFGANRAHIQGWLARAGLLAP